MSQPEESREKTAATDEVLLRNADDGSPEPADALRPPDDELPEEERRHSKAQHKLTG